ncbi:MAG: AgmX/PglI C-terminal domain-containing protein [Myxococcota bacterium]
MAIPLKVTIFRGSDLVGEQRFDRDIIKIGRLASAHLKLDDLSVSRIHAVIEVSSDGQDLSIIDMGSSDGTFVNGERISKEKLKDGDEVRVGAFRLIVTLDDSMSANSGDIVATAGQPPMPPPASFPPAGEQAPWMGMGLENVPTGMFQAAAVTQTAQAAWPQAQAAAPQIPAATTGQWATQPLPQVDMQQQYAAAAAAMQGNGNGNPAYDAYYAQQVAAVSQAYAAQTPEVQAQWAAQMQAQAQMAQMQMAQAQGQAQGQWPTPELAYPTGVPMPADYGYAQSGFAVQGAWGSVPNNLASDGVPETERALEVKTIWGNTVLDTSTFTLQRYVTMGDEPLLTGAVIKKLVRCDIEVPSKGLPVPRYPLAVSQSQSGATYGITLHASMSGHVEKLDGTIIPLQDLVQAGRGIERGELPETWVYQLQPEETVYVNHGMIILQLRYVRQAKFIPPPWTESLNYQWLNTFILVLFFHLLAVASFLAMPRNSESLDDQLFKNPNRFAQFRLTPEKKKEQENILAKLKAGEVGAKANKAEGKAGKKDHDKKEQGRMAVQGKPNEKELAKNTLEKLFGDKGRAASYLFGTGGLGGELKGALGGVTGAQIGDASGLGGLGTRGAGPGGGGLSMNSVGLGALGTQGRGGGGDGDYGTGIGNLGKKADRDINITAGNPVIMGSLDKELIRRVIEAHKAQIRYCYEKELVRTPGLFGKIDMEWTITADGLVREAKPKASTMNNPEVERCIAEKIRTWEFPKPKGGGIVVVRYPFVFKTAG